MSTKRNQQIQANNTHSLQAPDILACPMNNYNDCPKKKKCTDKTGCKLRPKGSK